jgi:hypothetical protein
MAAWDYVQVQDSTLAAVAELSGGRTDTSIVAPLGAVLTAYPFLFDASEAPDIAVIPGPESRLTINRDTVWTISGAK